MADAYSSIDDHIPWDNLSSDQQRLVNRGDTFATLKPFDTKQLITVPLQSYAAPPVFKRSAMSTMTGDIADLLPNLHACVQVGRRDRAAKLVRRMAEVFAPSAPELVDAHHQYLTGLLHTHIDAPTRETFGDIRKWFELEVRARGVTPDSRMFAIMIKASFALHQQTQLERTLRRYVEMAEELGSEVKQDTLSSELFSDNEWMTLLRLFPQEYEPPSVETIDSSSKLSKDSPPVLDLSKDGISAETSTSDLPELKGAAQKGLGLKALRESLASMYEIEEGVELDEQQAATLNFLRQERLEKDVLAASIEKWKEESELNRSMRRQGQITDPALGSYVYEWVQEMAQLVKEEIALATAAETKAEGTAQSEDVDRLLIGPFLRFSDPAKLSAAAVIAFMANIHDRRNSALGTDRTLVSFVTSIGNHVAQEIRLESVKSNILEKLKTLPSTERRRRLAKLLRQKPKKSTPVDDDKPSATDESQSITYDPPNSIKAKLGALFLSVFMKVARLPVTKRAADTGKDVTQVQPIASHSWMWRKGKRTGIIRVNPELLNRMKKEPVGSFIAKYLPMLIEPGKWQTLYKGPYVASEVPAVRFRDTSRSQHEYLRIADKRGDLKQVYAGLDVLGKVPWKVNRPLLKVLADIWNSGEGVGKLAPEDVKAEYPPTPDPSDKKAYQRWKSVVKGIEDEITGLHSQRCYQNFQLEVAKAYANETSFYCPHNIDFRGRAYPIPPYFNHMGADYVRGLFLFANGKELGETGLRWLKIHLANTYGFDKERLVDREAFSMDHLADVYDSATNPLGGKRWWLTAGHPWQCLAACMELKAALDSPVPSRYISHLPIQQDGTCNGLQHYAALGGDIVGAKQVNLVPGDKPADIYSAVADVVKEEVRKAAASGNKTAQTLDGKITRKVVKQPVMTNVYGVTYHGAKAQVRKQLVDIMPKAGLDNDVHLGTLSSYIATQIFGALGQMFNGAQAIQQWLGECGGRISQAVTPEQIERIKTHRHNAKANAKTAPNLKRRQLKDKEVDSSKEDYQFKSTIVWTTPLGLPVVQPYRNAKVKIIKTSLQNLQFEEPSLSDPVSKRRQLQAFPPNFIHSLDSCHMMLSALKCDELGLTFSSVHDSFWTHASDVPFMNRILRDAFVRMHSEDIIGRLREEFIARYKGCFNYSPIASDSPLAHRIRNLRAANKVSRSTFHRVTVTEGPQIDELLMEYERMQLLQSDDAEDNRKGREMVTPGSLFDADPAAALPLTSDADLQILGHKNDSGPASLDEHEMDVLGLDGHAEPSEDDVSASDQDDIDDVGVEMDNVADAAPTEQEEVVQGGDSVVKSAKKRTRSKRSGKMYLWTPIRFPPAPKKGEFDVTTLKDSQYFFS